MIEAIWRNFMDHGIHSRPDAPGAVPEHQDR